MKGRNSKTDRELSLSASEFIWDSEGSTEANRILASSMLRLLKTSQSKKILDLGCGNGFFSGFIHKNGYDVTGCDYSDSGIALAKSQFPQVNFFKQDVSQNIPLEHVGQYDTVISTEVIEHLLLPRKLIENAIEALKPNGVLILSAPYHEYLKNLAIALTNGYDEHWHPLRDYGHIKFFSKYTLMQLFQEFEFKNIQYETVGRIPVFARSMIISGTRP